MTVNVVAAWVRVVLCVKVNANIIDKINKPMLTLFINTFIYTFMVSSLLINFFAISPSPAVLCHLIVGIIRWHNP